MNDFFSRLGILGELLRFFWKRRMYWLIPMIVVIIIFGGLILLGGTGILSPFIYSVF
jgi:hypothetical protein